MSQRMRGNTRFITAAFAWLILSCSFWETSPCVPPRIGCEAPDFTLPTISGGSVKLSDLKGQAVMINFYATWCAPCHAETPGLVDLYREYADQGLTILGIDCEDSKEEITNFGSQYSITYPLLMGDKSLLRLYYVRSYPTTFFVDPDGKIVDLMIGSASEQEMRQYLQRILSLPMQQPQTATLAATYTPSTALVMRGCNTADSLNVRSGPSKTSQIVDWLVKGDCVLFDGRTADNAWLRLSETGNWVGSRYISLEGPITDLSIVE